MMHQEISPEETAKIMSKLATEWIERFDKDYFFSKDRKEVTEAVEYLFKILYHVCFFLFLLFFPVAIFLLFMIRQ